MKLRLWEHMSNRDPQACCVACLRLEHDQHAVHGPGTYPHCATLAPKCLRRRLSCTLSLPRPDSVIPPTASGAVEKPQRGDPNLTSQQATASWGSQLDLGEAQGIEVVDVESEDDEAPS